MTKEPETRSEKRLEKIAVPRGTADILPQDIASWQKVETIGRTILELYGYREIRTPIFENSGLFKRSLGQTSDIVNKQLLELAGSGRNEDLVAHLEDGSFEPLALRPEGTASIVRSYIENSIDKKESFSKFFYIGPMFRGERPQKGRLRQFHQIGVEAMGPNSSSPYLDAEVIALSMQMIRVLGLDKAKLKINTLGSVADKNNFAKHLRGQLEPHLKELCEDCQNRFERNVFRILDCKNLYCKQVVQKIDLSDSYLSSESRTYFEEVKTTLKGLGVQFEQSPQLVRGLDYYTHTIFEITDSSLGSQDALGAGGRYNDLVRQLGGPAVDAVGFALGIERILLAISKDLSTVDTVSSSLDAYLIPLDELSLKTALAYLENLRLAVYDFKMQNKILKNFSVDMGFRLTSLKSQMRTAHDRKARFVMILGENELKREIITLKDMANGAQEEVSLKEINAMAKRLVEGNK